MTNLREEILELMVGCIENLDDEEFNSIARIIYDGNGACKKFIEIMAS